MFLDQCLDGDVAPDVAIQDLALELLDVLYVDHQPLVLGRACFPCLQGGQDKTVSFVVVNLLQRQVHRSGTDSRRGEGRGSLYLTATLSPPE